MEKTERIELIHALMYASNAFHDALKERGFYVSYGLGDDPTGSIRRANVPVPKDVHLGDLTIQWKLKK